MIENIASLEYALLEQYQWSVQDIQDVVYAIYTASSDDTAITLGMVDFLQTFLMSTGPQQDLREEKEGESQDGVSAAAVEETPSSESTATTNYVTKDMLLACVLHFAECFLARKQGAQDLVRSILLGRRPRPVVTTIPDELFLESASEEAPDGPIEEQQPDVRVSSLQEVMEDSEGVKTSIEATAEDGKGGAAADEAEISFPHLEEDDDDDSVLRIARGAAELKRAEILVHAVYGDANSPSSTLTEEEASKIRGLLLTSVTNDWRSLLVRCVACLFRLEGILSSLPSKGDVERTPEVVRTAREGLRIYATLAEQLGMHRLKAMIEDKAFRILYRRQYKAVTALYGSHPGGSSFLSSGEQLQAVSAYLRARVAQTLREDEALMSQVEDVKVVARVKEPFSLWRKLLKKKLSKGRRTPRAIREAPVSTSHTDGDAVVSPTSSSLTESSDYLSVTDIPDAVALRVILRARKWSIDEPDEMTRNRDRLLCYYVQELLRSKWPAIDPKRMKDYIQFPKSNGYQSLHYTSSITRTGVEFPFEVQVRSEEMHHIAEHGVASHWGYKLGSKSAPTLIASTMAGANKDKANTTLLLPPSSVLEEEGTDAPLLVRSKDSSRHSPFSRAESLEPAGDAYLDALATARHTMANQLVYVFLAGTSSVESNKGKLIALPADSRVRDGLAVLTCDETDDAVEEVWLNGKIASLDDVVENGDVVLVSLRVACIDLQH
jgi:hypothetical protein